MDIEKVTYCLGNLRITKSGYIKSVLFYFKQMYFPSGH